MGLMLSFFRLSRVFEPTNHGAKKYLCDSYKKCIEIQYIFCMPVPIRRFDERGKNRSAHIPFIRSSLGATTFSVHPIFGIFGIFTVSLEFQDSLDFSHKNL